MWCGQPQLRLHPAPAKLWETETQISPVTEVESTRRGPGLEQAEKAWRRQQGQPWALKKERGVTSKRGRCRNCSRGQRTKRRENKARTALGFLEGTSCVDPGQRQAEGVGCAAAELHPEHGCCYFLPGRFRLPGLCPFPHWAVGS